MGAARLLRGLHPLTDPRRLTIVVNTGDDETFFGLHVSPDVDTILYTLAGLASVQQGWGIAGDTYTGLEALRRFYPKAWFQLGDRDLATHIYRTDALRRGAKLSKVTSELAGALGVKPTVLPMTDAAVRTFVTIAKRGALPFQEYLVHQRGRGTVERIEARGAAKATPAAGVLAAIRNAERIILPPSNPFVSIGPIMELKGVRRALRAAPAQVAAISPIVGGLPVKGPLHRMLRGLGHEVSPLGVAKLYADFVDLFVIDERDVRYAPKIAGLGMRVLVTDTLMTTAAKSKRLAAAVLKELEQ